MRGSLLRMRFFVFRMGLGGLYLAVPSVLSGMYHDSSINRAPDEDHAILGPW